MFLSLVAVNAIKISTVAGHVNINVAMGVEERFFKITVLYIITAAAEEMAGTAIRLCGASDTLSNKGKVNGWIGHTGTGRFLHVGIAVVVTRETIHIVRVSKIKVLVSPAAAPSAITKSV